MAEIEMLTREELEEELALAGYDEDRLELFGRSCERLVRMHTSGERNGRESGARDMLRIVADMAQQRATQARDKDPIGIVGEASARALEQLAFDLTRLAEMPTESQDRED